MLVIHCRFMPQAEPQQALSQSDVPIDTLGASASARDSATSAARLGASFNSPLTASRAADSRAAGPPQCASGARPWSSPASSTPAAAELQPWSSPVSGYVDSAGPGRAEAGNPFPILGYNDPMWRNRQVQQSLTAA